MDTAMVSGPEAVSAGAAAAKLNAMSEMTRGLMHSCECMPLAIFSGSGSRFGEAFDRVRLAVVHAEHRQEIGQAQRLPHPVLRLEQAQRRAETLRGLEALHQLAEAVAVDV